MSNLSAQEIAAVETAFDEHVHGLFKTLLRTLTDDPQAGAARFAAGIAFSRHAKELALGVTISAASPKLAKHSTRPASVKKRPKAK
jgi:hypothetical protein